MPAPYIPASYINAIETFSPGNNIHDCFIAFIRQNLHHAGKTNLFNRMVRKCGVVRRGSVLAETDLDPDNGAAFYKKNKFPSTKIRMQKFNDSVEPVLTPLMNKLILKIDMNEITNLIITTCTGFSAPFIDIFLMKKFGLKKNIERNVIGFMGCYAAINGLRMADHIVKSDPFARVLMINYELCTLHLQDCFDDLEKILSFLIFSDGASASVISAQETGLCLDGFKTVLLPDTEDLITWSIGDHGFDMELSGRVPGVIRTGLKDYLPEILGMREKSSIDLWAVHPGGQSILDAVEHGLDLHPSDLATSRDILAGHGNMSSATVMFVLEKMLKSAASGALGCGMAFGPGLIAETMIFRKVG